MNVRQEGQVGVSAQDVVGYFWLLSAVQNSA